MEPSLKKKLSRKFSRFNLMTSKPDLSTASSQASMPDLHDGRKSERHSTLKLKSNRLKSASIPNLPRQTMDLPNQGDDKTSPSKSATVLSPLEPPPNLLTGGPSRPASSQSLGSIPMGQPPIDATGSTSSSPALVPRPATAQSPNGKLYAGARSSTMLSKRQSWLMKKPSPAKEVPAATATEPKAWIAGLKERIPYDLSPLLRGQRIQDLWNENADTFVYLFPSKSDKGPSFKIASSLLSGSKVLLNLSRRDNPSNADLTSMSTDPSSAEAATNQQAAGSERSGHLSPHGSGRGHSSSDSVSSVNMRLANDFQDEDVEDRHLYMPLEMNPSGSVVSDVMSSDEQELLVLYRNFFAFLSGGALVATRRQCTLFSIFSGIGSILYRFGFSNVDGSTFGEVVSSSFTRYCEELRLSDVRGSREKTIEAIVLGEKMKAWSLYNEGFVHGAGKLSQMKALHSPKYSQITSVTRNRLERAALDLAGRIRTVQTKLEEFEFPSMFAGIANSQMAVEAKSVRFKAWKTAFFNMKKHVVAHYRQRYGDWPPKAKSKKNSFEESGLNRLLLLDMYADFTNLYDMLADRTQLTDRTIDMAAPQEDVDFRDSRQSMVYAMRRIESEYDRSTPPVQPPIPFDIPLFPSLATSFYRGHVKDPTKDKNRRLRDNKVNDLLLGSYNRDSMKPTPFLEDFLRFERRCGQNCTVDDMMDTRCGQWLFLYAVLQSLPMVVVDARDIQFSQGVEYFLCVPPRGGRPWMKEDTSQSRSWFNVSSGGGVVSMPADVIDHSVEGIYRRSHCWTVAAKWVALSDAISPTTQMALGASFPPPPVVGGPSLTTTTQVNSPYLHHEHNDTSHSLPYHSNASFSNVSFATANNSTPNVSNVNASNPNFENPNLSNPNFAAPLPTFHSDPGLAGPQQDYNYSYDSPHGSNHPSPVLTPTRPASSFLPHDSPDLSASIPTSTAGLQPPSSLGAAGSRRSLNPHFGLEALPLPPGATPDGFSARRPVSIHDPTKTFDSILGGAEKAERKKRALW